MKIASAANESFKHFFQLITPYLEFFLLFVTFDQKNGELGRIHTGFDKCVAFDLVNRVSLIGNSH
jgi:hypothetical protein